MSKNLNPPAKWMENDGKVVTATYSQGGEKEWLYFDFQEGTPQCAHTADYYDSSFSYIFDMVKKNIFSHEILLHKFLFFLMKNSRKEVK